MNVLEITSLEQIKSYFNKISKTFPRCFTMPFATKEGIINIGVNILGGWEDKIFLSLNTPEDHSLVSGAEFNFENFNVITRYCLVDDEMILFDIRRQSIEVVEDKEKLEKLQEEIRKRFELGHLEYKSYLNSQGSRFFLNELNYLLILVLPSKIKVNKQRRKSERIKVDSAEKYKFYVANKIIEDNINISVGISNQELTYIKRYFNFVKFQKHSLEKLLLDFVGRLPKSILSPYFGLTSVLNDYVDRNSSLFKIINSNYRIFTKIRGIVENNQSAFFSNGTSVIPLFIYGSVEGHFLIINSEKKQLPFFQELAKILTQSLQSLDIFDITTGEDLRLEDISENGLRFSSFFKNHERLQKGSSFRVFTVLGKKKVEIPLITVDNKKDFMHGKERYNIKCKIDFSIKDIHRKAIKDFITLSK